mmetsp:Transcript_9709/g.14478  ORF Transcript_9709/g.14478 Transcript_9709/m.14478 type:complete len:98 (+) Transcript_9709:70-363(+)
MIMSRKQILASLLSLVVVVFLCPAFGFGGSLGHKPTPHEKYLEYRNAYEDKCLNNRSSEDFIVSSIVSIAMKAKTTSITKLLLLNFSNAFADSIQRM